jgi:hypothetical protein
MEGLPASQQENGSGNSVSHGKIVPFYSFLYFSVNEGATGCFGHFEKWYG